jgi:predicted ATP-dependent Lon-type protease
MALKDRITIDLSGYSQEQIEKFKKAFADRVGLVDNQTWEDVTLDMAKQKLADVIKAWVKGVDDVENRQAITYTDMDA